MPSNQQDKALLLATARTVARELRTRCEGTRMRIREPKKISIQKTDTDGWEADIGNLGKGQPILEMWLDRYSGHPTRKLNACFWSREPKKIISLSRNVSHLLWPVRRVVQADVKKDGFYFLAKKLSRAEFNKPVLENYKGIKSHFFGFYDPTRNTQSGVNAYFSERATAFFVDVVRSQPGASKEDIHPGIYPRCENRSVVQSHLARERSAYLAVECKKRDGYCCQVCKMTFASTYGRELGASFAEAHHIKPLGKQPDKVRTKIEDLITVCANCHRMLHRMDGKSSDVKKLKAIVRTHGKDRR